MVEITWANGGTEWTTYHHLLTWHKGRDYRKGEIIVAPRLAKELRNVRIVRSDFQIIPQTP